ncbi:PREDICTED: transient receptor potential cation channel subfamily V member 6-like [Nanorana parkeri]|uniref:transient receptor potential cation channel subfamily V member 6-like n=1 Tax=Nanorana parkeri TaxID=125878 RepID=UPI000854FEEA|nr:PREDICTED: transient receptor potential cation channel subfamily V member 6-like [Nanorana parkeri]
MASEKRLITIYNQENTYRAKENLFFKAAKGNNVKLLRRLIKENINPSLKGAMGENVLHVAALYNNMESLCMLLDAFPFLINTPIECDIYKGETALHIAIINQNIEMVKELIDREADMYNACAMGTFFAPSKKGHYYYGEYVISFAACVGNVEIIRLLVEKGAPLDAQDSQGNTVFHILVLHPNKTMACKTYDFLASLISKEHVSCLESITNKNGLTPLKLAAQEGDVLMFNYFMEKKKHVYWTFGPLKSTLYDLTGIDSWNDKLSVIDIICTCNNNSALNLLAITPLKELLQYKWSTFGYKYFLLCTFLYILYTIILTLCCLYRPLMEETADGEKRKIITRPFYDSYKTQNDYVRLSGEIIVILGGILILLIEVAQLIRKGPKRFFGNTVRGGPFHIIMFLHACFIIAVITTRLLHNEGETIAMSLALISGWCNVIYFARGFRLLGPLCIMIQKMIMHDLMRFCVILFTVLIGFAAAMNVHFQAMNVTVFPAFRDFSITLFTLLQLMMGLDNLPVPPNVTMPKIISTLYLVYMFFAFVLLLNLLIALMTDTHFRVNSERTRLWHAQVAATTVMLERIVPSRLWARTGIPGEKIGLEPGKWYFR